MLIFILLGFVALLVVAGIAIAVQAKRRKDGSVERPPTTMTDEPKVARANGRDD